MINTIVFQGTPEELGNFDHPFMMKLFIASRVAEELTGLYSKRNSKF